MKSGITASATSALCTIEYEQLVATTPIQKHLSLSILSPPTVVGHSVYLGLGICLPRCSLVGIYGLSPGIVLWVLPCQAYPVELSIHGSNRSSTSRSGRYMTHYLRR